MGRQIMSRRKAHALSVVLFLVGLAVLTVLKTWWWPGIMLVVGLCLALRQYLMGRLYDTIISLVVFLGIFVSVQFKIDWDLLLPILFTLGAIYILFKEFFGPKETTEEEKEKDLNKEIEEESHKKD